MKRSDNQRLPTCLMIMVSCMTGIAYEEASLIARSSKRPRFALCVWLALLELADGGSEWRGTRGELAEVISALLPPDRFAGRHAARIARLSTAGREKLDTVDERERDRASPWRHLIQTVLIAHAAGNPIGENVSRTLTELRRARLIDIGYVDRFGAMFPKPARGRRLSITLKRRAEARRWRPHASGRRANYDEPASTLSSSSAPLDRLRPFS